jgi:DNA-binding HxlR family transcriptional regulator
MSGSPISAEEERPTLMTSCPMTAALNAIGGKWSLICLYFLDSGTRRFNELRRLIPEVSHKVLAETLRNLEEEGLIVRTVHSLAPSHVEYEISEHGHTVRPLIHVVRSWGRQHLTWKEHARCSFGVVNSPS